MSDKESREKKIRNFKREILQAKFSDIRKRSMIRLPEIRRSVRREEPPNLEELRKDIEAVKLISVTSYNISK